MKISETIPYPQESQVDPGLLVIKGAAEMLP
jgi:hypothetical protein